LRGESSTPGGASTSSHWAAWKPSSDLAVVYDDRTRRRRRVAVPDCPLAGVTAGTLLLQCPEIQSPPEPLLVDVATGTVTNVGGPDLVSDALGALVFIGVGSRGLLVDNQGYHYRQVYAFDWRTRRRQGLDDPSAVVDLNRPELTRPLCAGLERSRDPEADDENGPPYLPMVYRGRRAIEYAHGRVRLWRCGVHRPRVIKKCACQDVNLASGLVTWADTRARAVDLASGKRRAWRLPAGYGRVAQAGRTLLLWSEPPGRLRIVRWPKRR
jgi:hypothetical protein